MEKNNISLLYPISDREYESEGKISDGTFEELGLNELINLKNSRLCDFFTSDPDVIRYRQEVFADTVNNQELCDILIKLNPILSDISEIRKLSSDTDFADEYLYSITEIELYISCMELLKKRLCPIRDTLNSTAFKALAGRIGDLTESDYYKDLNAKLKELTSRVSEAKSITIGVNLDAQLRPESAGVLSVNNKYFKSGEIIQKILRFDFKNDDYTCIASLTPFNKGDSENRQSALSNAFRNALNEIYKSSMKSWKKIVQTYVLENADFLIKLMPEIEFIVRGTEFIKSLEQTGNPICFPKIFPLEEKIFNAVGIYNPMIAMKIENKMVQNDFAFDKEGMFYVLSGPNRGGKSVITCAVGATFALCGLGLCAPAESAEISPADNILLHFPTGSEDTVDKGRLGEECARLDEIFGQVSENSLVLLDETLSSTGSFEGAYIASEVLSGFSMANCRGIFSTHLHELAAMIDDINKNCSEHGGAKIDTLVAGMEEGERSFKILRAKPNGQSYARDIANKYGISLDHILKKIGKK